ncbi:hypothetical protein GCM10020001_017170 [Nonomuraea salmonea]
MTVTAGLLPARPVSPYGLAADRTRPPRDAGARAGDPLVRADVELVEAAGAQEDHLAGVATGSVAAGLGRDGEPGQAGVPDQGRHVVGVGRLHDGPYGLLDRQVPGPPRQVETLVARHEHPAAQFVLDVHAFPPLVIVDGSTVPDRVWDRAGVELRCPRVRSGIPGERVMTGLEFRLFGPLEVTGGDRIVLDLGTRKQRALVAMLALEPGRVVSLDRLIDELWAGEPPAGATRTLQAYIAHLRRVLEPGRPPRTPPGVLLTRDPGYLLAIAPGQVDLWRFTAWADEGRAALAQGAHERAAGVLGRALDLWRGDPLGEFAGEEFAQPVVARLAETRVTAMEDRFDARLALGESASLIPGLEALVEHQPYRERAWSLLVLALYRSGRQADALAALRRVRTRLADDLGLSPGPGLRELEQAVFGQAPDLRPPPPVSVTEPVPEPGEVGLIARSGQLELVQRLLGEARRDRGGVVLVTGEAGIGKTRLVHAAADLAAARGFQVVWGGSAWTAPHRPTGHGGRSCARPVTAQGCCPAGRPIQSRTCSACTSRSPTS